MTATQTPAPSSPLGGGAGQEIGRAAALQGEGVNAARPVLDLMEHREPLLADREWTMALYSMFARGGDDELLYYTVIPGEPWSKSRPRFARNGRTYQPRDDREAEARLRARIAAANVDEFPGNVMVACRFYRSSMQRVDTDNLVKHVCDSATGVLWKDDSQVTLVVGELHLDRAFPRTVILVGNHTSTMTRGEDDRTVCVVCETAFRRPSNNPRKRTCSRACQYAIRGLPDLSVPIACPICGEGFVRKTSTQKTCSPECRRESLRRPRGRRVVHRCTQCGAELAHNRGGRCRDCWRAHPSGQPDPVQGEFEVNAE